MFTFSFSTAFATAANTEQVAALEKAYAYAQAQLDANYDAAMASIVSADDLGYSVSESTWTALGVKASLDKFLADKTSAQAETWTATTSLADEKVTEKLAYEIYGNLFGYNDSNVFQNSKANLVNYIKTYYGPKAAKAQFKADLAEAIEAYDAVDWSLYSSTDVEPVSKLTYLALAEKKVAEGKAAAEERAEVLVDSVVLNADGTFATTTYSALGAMKDAFVPAYVSVKDVNSASAGANTALLEKTVEVTGTHVGLGIYMVKGVDTISAVEDGKLVNQAQAAAMKAEAQSKYATYITTTTNPDKDGAAAYLAAVNYLADKGEIVTVPTVATALGYNVLTKHNAVLEMEADAARYAAEKDGNGDLIRDAEEVADLVEEFAIATYKDALAGTSTAPIDTLAKIKALTSEGYAAKLEYVKAALKADLEDKKAAAADEYYPAELVKVVAIYDAAIVKLEAQKTVDKVEDAYADAATKLAAANIKKSGAVDTAVTGLTAYGTVKTAVQHELDYMNYGKTLLDADYVSNANIDDVLKAYIGENGARTEAEVKALAANAKEIAASMTTAGAVKAAKAAVEAQIAALPAKVTSADKDAVVAAWNAANDYAKLTFKTDIASTDIAAAKKTALTSAIDTLFSKLSYDLALATSKVDKTDKAALKALNDQIVALQDLTEAGEIFAGKTYTDSVVGATLASIKNKEKVAVETAIKRLPINVTEADAAAVKAARELYEAYVAEYTNYDIPNTWSVSGAFDANYPGFVNIDITELIKAEAALGLNYDAEENAKAYVQDLKIAARSTKTSKGVKVTIKADVQELLDNGFTVEYKFYRSTKSNKNFGTAKVTKTTNTYLNTSGVKGTKYYYKAKLVVKNAEGEVVATTPLTQCLYATRTF